MKRKVICILCAVLLVAGMAGCSGDKKEAETEQTDTSGTDTGENAKEAENTEEKEAPNSDEDEFPGTQATCTEPGPSGFVATPKYSAFYVPAGFGSSGEGEVQIYDSNDIYTRLFEMDGPVSGLMGTVDDIYFVLNDNLYAYSGGEDAEMLISDVAGFSRFVGAIDGTIYYTYVNNPDDPTISETRVVAYNTESKEKKEYAIESAWGNVDALITGKHLFYQGGRTDPSATPLYELNLESGESVKLEDFISGMAPDEEGRLYFTSYETYDSMQGEMTLKCYDTLTEEKTEVFTTASDLGSMVTVDQGGAFFERNWNDINSLTRLDLESGELENINLGGEHYYIPDCMGNTFYCGAYRVDRTGKEPVITGTTVYTYTKNLETESGDVLSPLEVRYNLNHGQVLGVGNGIAFVYQKEFRGDRTYETYGVGPATKYDDQLFY